MGDPDGPFLAGQLPFSLQSAVAELEGGKRERMGKQPKCVSPILRDGCD